MRNKPKLLLFILPEVRRGDIVQRILTPDVLVRSHAQVVRMSLYSVMEFSHFAQLQTGKVTQEHAELELYVAGYHSEIISKNSTDTHDMLLCKVWQTFDKVATEEVLVVLSIPDQCFGLIQRHGLIINLAAGEKELVARSRNIPFAIGHKSNEIPILLCNLGFGHAGIEPLIVDPQGRLPSGYN